MKYKRIHGSANFPPSVQLTEPVSKTAIIENIPDRPIPVLLILPKNKSGSDGAWPGDCAGSSFHSKGHRLT